MVLYYFFLQVHGSFLYVIVFCRLSRMRRNYFVAGTDDLLRVIYRSSGHVLLLRLVGRFFCLYHEGEVRNKDEFVRRRCEEECNRDAYGTGALLLPTQGDVD